jgi:uncharacterized protein
MDEGFDWDDVKAESNYRKHGVSFETAARVFEDHFALERFDASSGEYGEDRFIITGMARGRLLTVVHTERDEITRIISARKASKSEHDDYFSQNSEE